MEKFGDRAQYEEDFDDVKSKSEIKRELLAIKEMGRTLVELPTRDLDKLSLDLDLYDQIIKAKGLTHGALKRQIGFLGSLIANDDYESIQAGLEKLKQVHQGEVKQFQQLELWRDQLLAGDASIMSLMMNQFEEFDIQYVRQLVRNAAKEAKLEKPPKSARALFKYLQSCKRLDA